jgi:flavorubredoxin
MFIAVVYSGLVSIRYDNFKGITLELDKIYSNTSEMEYATIEELRKRGKECEIEELRKGYPKL